MNKNITVRAMTLDDCESVTQVYKNEPGWWHELDMCREITEKRMNYDWYITVALRDGSIVGHAEWIVDYDEDGRYLYLDELQVIKAQQHSGIGRAILDDGLQFARKNNINRIVTIPEQDTGSEVFYIKCGFIKIKERLSIELAVTKFTQAVDFIPVDEVPFSVLNEKKMIFGLTNSPKHMWVIENDKISFDSFLSYKFVINANDYVQFRCKPFEKTAVVVYWCAKPQKDDIRKILQCASTLGIEVVEFEFLEKYGYLFDDFNVPVDVSEIVMVKYVV